MNCKELNINLCPCCQSLYNDSGGCWVKHYINSLNREGVRKGTLNYIKDLHRNGTSYYIKSDLCSLYDYYFNAALNYLSKDNEGLLDKMLVLL